MKLNYLCLSLLFVTLVAASVLDVIAGGRTETAPTNSSSTAAGDSETALSGEQVWSNHCQRCHNLRSPDSFTPVQWQVIVHQMRVRGNISGPEARAITEFLKSASH